MLLGLCKRPINDEGRVAILAQRGGGRRWHQARDRTELALPHELFLNDRELGHHRVVLLLAPGADDVLTVVTENCVLHAALLAWRFYEDGAVPGFPTPAPLYLTGRTVTLAGTNSESPA